MFERSIKLRLIEYKAVITNIPASSASILSFVWMMPVKAPAAPPASNDIGIIKKGFHCFISNKAVTTAPNV